MSAYPVQGNLPKVFLRHGSYFVRGGIAPDDFVIWGDYFFLEALMRLNNGRPGYWYEPVRSKNNRMIFRGFLNSERPCDLRLTGPPDTMSPCYAGLFFIVPKELIQASLTDEHG